MKAGNGLSHSPKNSKFFFLICYRMTDFSIVRCLGIESLLTWIDGLLLSDNVVTLVLLLEFTLSTKFWILLSPPHFQNRGAASGPLLSDNVVTVVTIRISLKYILPCQL